MFRRVFFGSPEGRWLLAFILRDLGVFYGQAASAEDMIERNVGMRLLWYSGIWHEENGPDVLAELQKVNPVQEEE